MGYLAIYATAFQVMLRELHIKDYALIDEIRVEFSSGLNIITGETGAGKSILIGSLGQVLGERAATEFIRTGADRYVVEALFLFDRAHPVFAALKQLGVEIESGELILRREVSREGYGRCYANDTQVTARALKSIGDLLVDIHGPHSHQSLLKVEKHIDFLDSFGQIEDLVGQMEREYRRLTALRDKLEELKQKRTAAEEKRELYRFQLKEITDASPDLKNLEQLEQQYTVLENRERLAEDVIQLYNLLYGGEDSVVERLGRGAHWLRDAARFDQLLAEKSKAYDSLIYELEDLSSFLRDYGERLSDDPQRLEELRNKLAALDQIKRKYGGNVEKVWERKEFLERELAFSEDIDHQIEEVEEAVLKLREEFSRRCASVSRRRRTVASRLAVQVESSLRQLGIPNAQFEVRFFDREDPKGEVEIEDRRYNPGPKGIEEVEFFISTNAGEERKPLAKIVSLGEISRIMLSLKSILAEVDAIPTLIFDEIDVGISGRIAEAVGRKMKQLSTTHQIISITHLPQIAKMADRHLSVFKEVREGRSTTRAVCLTEEERVEELARLLEGEMISQTALRHAKEMLQEAERSPHS
ncbi:MAG: DNA repair protein RecN [Candidatus Latescibacterota bacterium]|nr:MAG: DNA repair protein RecN [Candidatus Latescibacterota bacterium]RKY73794.1 MAG: DNA repair protein RecN [Candidatus Latescibacterota bacterium]